MLHKGCVCVCVCSLERQKPLIKVEDAGVATLNLLNPLGMLKNALTSLPSFSTRSSTVNLE